MKRNFLLMIGLLLSTVVAFAEWTCPVVGEEFSETGQSYFYNVEYAGFYCGDNDWGTRASVSRGEFKDNRHKGILYVNVGEGAAEGFLRFGETSPDGLEGVWMDGSRAGNDMFFFTKIGDTNTFTIGCGKDDSFQGKYLTWGGSESNTMLNFTESSVGGTWMRVSKDEYDLLMTGEKHDAYQCYVAAMQLKKAIAACEEEYPEVDLSSVKAVYNNEDSTIDQLKAAIAEIDDAIDAWKKGQVDWDAASLSSPLDLTSLIINPTFDVIGDFTGWKGTGWGAGGTTSTCAERFQVIFDTYQQITNLHTGIYRVKVDGFYRAGSTEEAYKAYNDGKPTDSQLYAQNIKSEGTPDEVRSNIKHLFEEIEPGEHLDINGDPIGGLDFTDKETGDTYYVANSMLDFTNYNGTTKEMAKPFYSGNSVIVPVTEGTLQLGVKNTNANTSTWTIVDNFGLEYLGNSAEAWAYLYQDYKKNVSLDENALITPSVKDAFNDAVDKQNVTDYASYQNAIDAIAEAKKAVDENSAAWDEYVEQGKQAKEILADPNYAAVATELAQYVREYYDALMDKSAETYLIYETAQLKEQEDEDIKVGAIEHLKQLVSDARKLTPINTEIKLQNPKFEEGWTGWEHSGSGGNFRTSPGDKCAEAWNTSNFDVYQMVENVPAGIYTVELQGFYRYLGGDNSWRASFYDDGIRKTEGLASYLVNSPVSVYINEVSSSIPNIYDEEVENGNLYVGQSFDPAPYADPNGIFWYPNDMKSSGIAFGEGLYKAQAVGVVKEGEPLRIGIKGTTTQGNNSWCIFTNFKLVYRANDVRWIREPLDAQLEKLRTLLDQDVNMGTDVRGEAEIFYAAAMEASTADEVIEAISDVAGVIESVTASIQNFKDFAEFLEEAWGKVDEYEGEGHDTSDLQLALGIAEAMVGDATDGEIAAAKKSISLEMGKLELPEGYEEASVENMFDMTSVIKDADFSGVSVVDNKYGEWTWRKKAGNGPNYSGAFEFWGGAAADAAKDLDFDISQDIVLPAGTYALLVNARSSYNGQAPLGNDGRVNLYAEVGDEEPQAFTTAMEPEDVSAANDRIDYTVYFTVTEDFDWVKVGVKTIGLQDARWCSGTDFRLYYYGDCTIEQATGLKQASAEVIEALASKAIKFVKNGKLVIKVNGVTYNAAGAAVE